MVKGARVRMFYVHSGKIREAVGKYKSGELAVELTRELAIPCGVVINRADHGDSGVASYCREQGIPVLLHIPLERRIAELYCRGIPLVRGMPQWHNAFLDLFQNIAGLISVRVGGSRE